MKAICSSVVSSFLGVKAGMVSMGRLRSSPEQRRSSSDRYELASAPHDDMQDRYGLGIQLELLLLRRIGTDCAWERVFDVLLSVRARGCDVGHVEFGDALRSAEYAEVGAFVV